jgi:hypothetical protein
MARENEVSVIGVTQIPVGLSALVQVNLKASEFMTDGFMKFTTGSASLEIVSGASAGTDPATKRGTGYMLGINTDFPLKGPAQFWLCATGATVIAQFAMMKTAGATLI